MAISETSVGTQVEDFKGKVQSAPSEVLEHVLRWNEVPAWMKIDPYLKRGYRRQLNTYCACFQSLFYAHNESINTWSHLLPALFFMALLAGRDFAMIYTDIKAPLSDILVLQLYIAGTAGCLLLSVSDFGFLEVMK